MGNGNIEKDHVRIHTLSSYLLAVTCTVFEESGFVNMKLSQGISCILQMIRRVCVELERFAFFVHDAFILYIHLYY